MDSCLTMKCCQKKLPINSPDVDGDLYLAPKCDDHDNHGGPSNIATSRSIHRLSELFNQHHRSHQNDHVSIIDPCLQRALHNDTERTPSEVHSCQILNRDPNEYYADPTNIFNNGDVRKSSNITLDGATRPEHTCIPEVVLRVQEDTGSLIVDMAMDDRSSEATLSCANSTATLQTPAHEESYTDSKDDTDNDLMVEDAVLLATSTPKHGRLGKSLEQR